MTDNPNLVERLRRDLDHLADLAPLANPDGPPKDGDHSPSPWAQPRRAALISARSLVAVAVLVLVGAIAIPMVLTSSGHPSRGIHVTGSVPLRPPVPSATTNPPSSTLPATSGVPVLPVKRACTAADLATARTLSMPIPQRLVRPVVLGGFSLLPVPATVRPATTAHQAWQTIASTTTIAGGTPEIFIAIDNSPSLYKGDLVWVVHVSHTPLDYAFVGHGPPQHGNAPTTTVVDPPCLFWDSTSLVNARTGAQLNGEGQSTYD